MQAKFMGILLCSAPLMVTSAWSQTPSGCVPIDRAGFLITLPGVYCVTRDLNTRLDFADHSAENPVINIGVGNVTVDLQGHRIGRGSFIIQHGGSGFLISTLQPDGAQGASPRIDNVTIRNGVLADFGVGISYFASAYQRPRTLRQPIRTDDKTFIYGAANIVMKDLKFERCSEDMNFQDWVTQ